MYSICFDFHLYWRIRTSSSANVSLRFRPGLLHLIYKGRTELIAGTDGRIVVVEILRPEKSQPVYGF
jgi:hypothetical protein